MAGLSPVVAIVPIPVAERDQRIEVERLAVGTPHVDAPRSDVHPVPLVRRESVSAGTKGDSLRRARELGLRYVEGLLRDPNR